MDKKLFKSILLLITYTVVLVMVLSRLGLIAGGVAWVLGLVKPLLIGFALAFVLNRPCHFFFRLYDRGLSRTRARGGGPPPGGGHLLSGADSGHRRHLFLCGAQAGGEHPDLRPQPGGLPGQRPGLVQRYHRLLPPGCGGAGPVRPERCAQKPVQLRAGLPVRPGPHLLELTSGIVSMVVTGVLLPGLLHLYALRQGHPHEPVPPGAAGLCARPVCRPPHRCGPPDGRHLHPLRHRAAH